VVVKSFISIIYLQAYPIFCTYHPHSKYLQEVLATICRIVHTIIHIIRMIARPNREGPRSPTPPIHRKSQQEHQDLRPPIHCRTNQIIPFHEIPRSVFSEEVLSKHTNDIITPDT